MLRPVASDLSPRQSLRRIHNRPTSSTFTSTSAFKSLSLFLFLQKWRSSPTKHTRPELLSLTTCQAISSRLPNRLAAAPCRTYCSEKSPTYTTISFPSYTTSRSISSKVTFSSHTDHGKQIAAMPNTDTAAAGLPAGSSIPHREQRPQSVERVTDHLETPSLDDRTYRVVRLSNKLEALLVHDPETDKASAALDCNVGNFSDEEEMPGMAHAVEHVRPPSPRLCLDSESPCPNAQPLSRSPSR